MTRRTLFSLLLLLVVSGLLTLFRIPVASSQGATLVAAYVEGDLPVEDPEAAAWDQATPLEIPLSAQTVAKPTLPESRIRSLRAQALHNGTELAILLTWEDPTEDVSMVRVEDFRDAVAVQFPLQEGQPFFCMGQPGGDVNIWHWKADWQADMTAWQDVETAFPNMSVNYYPFAEADQGALPRPDEYTDPSYLPALAAGNLFAAPNRPSPVEDLMASGFGSLIAQPPEEQNVGGLGLWANGTWKVIFHRSLASDQPHDVSFEPGQVYSIAFAVWDGSNGERDGEKSTSQWVSLQLAPAAAPPAEMEEEPSAEPFIFVIGPMAAALVLILLFISAAVLFAWVELRRRQR